MGEDGRKVSRRVEHIVFKFVGGGEGNSFEYFVSFFWGGGERREVGMIFLNFKSCSSA